MTFILTKQNKTISFYLLSSSWICNDLIYILICQVVERLFLLLSDCMWETPIAQAKHAIQIKEKEQEMKLQVMMLLPALLTEYNRVTFTPDILSYF